MPSMSDTISNFLQVIVKDDEHRESEIVGGSIHFLDNLVMIIELFEDGDDSFQGDLPFDGQED